MSDKTCGKCAVWAHVANDIGVCSVGGTTVGEDDYFEIRSEFDNCRHLDSYKPYECTIEQRYEKLKRIAVEMLTVFPLIRMNTLGKITMAAEPINEACLKAFQGYKEKLEALGVSIDD